MENNIPNQTPPTQTPPVSPPVPPAPSQPETPPTQTPQTPQPIAGNPTNKSKTILFVILGILFLVAIGVIYFLALQSNAKSNEIPEVTPIPQEERITPTTTPIFETDSSSVESIDIGNPEKELETIEKDLNQL